MYKTHIVFALFFYLLIALIFNLSKEFYILLLISIAALLPDIDSSKSYINRLFSPGKILAKISKHRGFWHSVFGLLLIFLISLILFKLLSINLLLSFYVAFGYLMHLIADSLTVSGIRPFWKFSNTEIKGKIKTDTAVEYGLFFVLLLLIAFLLKPQLLSKSKDLLTSFFIKH